MDDLSLLDALRCLAALLLPWAAGRACLQPLVRRSDLTPAAALGYGFFLGAALLYLALLLVDGVIGRHSFPATALVLMLAGAAGLLAPGPEHARGSGTGRTPRLAAAALLVLLAAHLGWIAVNAGWLPTYPWDAWQTWTYKAKAWFHTVAMVTVAEPAVWLTDLTAPFNAPGGRYPGLVPAYSFWVTDALGAWHEGAAHAPGLLAGFALLLALGGQAAGAAGYGLPGLIGAYGLLSLPLVGTHLALTGYADLWLAGFSGLGMIALLRSVLDPHAHQGALASLFLAAGFLVKHDALLWCTLALALWLACRRPRLFGLAGVAVVALTGLALLAGAGMLEIPGLGAVGIEGGVLHLGPFASLPLKANAVADDYLRHLWVYDSWHLLWYFLIAGALAVAGHPALRALRRPVLLYLLFLAGSQAFIFGGTAAGAWAEDGTALNRLLLQQAPVLVFILVLVGSRLTAGLKGGTAASTFLAAAVAGVAIGGGLVGWLLVQAGPAATPATVPLRAVVGEARPDNGALTVTAYRDGMAVLSSGRTALDAASLPLLDLGLAPPAGASGALFWRRADLPRELHARRLNPERRRMDLRNEPEWRGRVIELGIIAYASSEGAFRILPLTLTPATAGGQARILLENWLPAGSWTQADINARKPRGGGLPALVPTVAAWLAAALMACLLAARRRGGGVPGGLPALCLAAWLLLDARWLAQGMLQAGRILDRYGSAGALPTLPVAGDRDLFTFAGEVRALLGEPSRRVYLVAEDPRMRFELQRMRYHLLPQRAYVHEGPLADVPAGPGQPLVVLRRRASSALTTTAPALSGRELRLSSAVGLLVE